jgi:dTDP-4-dehydrorhamnose reductase
MLGSAFSRIVGDQAIEIGRDALYGDIPQRLSQLLDLHKPDAFINCAADVNADAAEVEPDNAFFTNSVLPGFFAAACRRRDTRFLHFSSTGCYGDWKSGPYLDYDELKPTTVHHRSKIAGEFAVRSATGNHLILRTGWLFGGGPHHKRNFVWRRIVEAANVPTLASDATQRGNPTFVDDVVNQSMSLLRAGITGTYNCVSETSTTRFGYVSEILSQSGLSCRVEPSSAFSRAAPVSSNETASNYYLSLVGLNIMPAWRTSLATYIREVRNWPEWKDILNSRPN